MTGKMSVTKYILVFLLTSITALNAESSLDDLALDEKFALDGAHQHHTSADPGLPGAEYIDEDINESSGEDYKFSPSAIKKESIIYKAMLEALKRPEMSQQLGQVLPIIRSMSPPQRLTLAALLTAQVMSSPTSEAPTLDQVIAMFAGGPEEDEEQRKNMTSALLLPLSLDIANIFRGVAAKTPEAMELRHLRVVAPHRRIIVTQPHGHQSPAHRTRPTVPFRTQPSSHNRRNANIPTEMVPPPPPPSRPLPGVKPRRPPPGKHTSSPLRQPVPERKHSAAGEPSSSPNKDTCDYFTNTLCLEVADYPKDAILASIHRSQGAVAALLTDIKQQPGDVTSETKTPLHETRYAPDHSASGKNRRQDHDNSLRDFGSEDGYLCPSSVKYARPKRARATSGQWKFIVNTGDYTQTLRLEMCQRPHEACTFISDNFRSECSQVYNYHRLLTWDDVKGLHMDIFKVPTCCSCHVQGYAFNFPPRGSPDSQGTSPRPEHFPGADFVAEDQGLQQQNTRPNEGFQADFVDDPNLRPPLLTNSEQFHDESFSQTFNNDQGIRGPFNNRGGQFQSDISSNQFQDQVNRNKFNFQEERTRNQFHFQNDETRNQFQEDNSRKHFQGEIDLRAPLQSPKRETVHFPKRPELHVTPPPSSFQVPSLFQRQGFKHPTSEDLIPPAGPPLPLAHENGFQTFSGNQLLRRSRNQTSLGLRDDIDLEVEETAVKRHPFPNAISTDAIRIAATKATTTAITTIFTTTTTTPAPVTLPSKPSLTITGGGKRVNYNYHPIIDYFKTQQSKGFDQGNTQDWRPIVGNAERLTKDTSR
ncbi:hypothetical protein B7P43_G04352 [Cryptotermes secundus]|uniref:Uncharacterized protein n=1 Tax=Cryptotermes secundus TaxID=105785 RepID=A0A2J7RE25_9NEOP|nr:neurotrophin 1 isoform X2 [Cryptotermes secundus]PNF39081.1 hypothetical protein B7P43_G04352 [Cryptotermes secundus]